MTGGRGRDEFGDGEETNSGTVKRRIRGRGRDNRTRVENRRWAATDWTKGRKGRQSGREAAIDDVNKIQNKRSLLTIL